MSWAQSLNSCAIAQNLSNKASSIRLNTSINPSEIQAKVNACLARNGLPMNNQYMPNQNQTPAQYAYNNMAAPQYNYQQAAQPAVYQQPVQQYYSYPQALQTQNYAYPQMQYNYQQTIPASSSQQPAAQNAQMTYNA